MNFNEICKFCNHEMDLIDNHTQDYIDCQVYIYWCPYCGAVLNWWDEKPIQDDDWSEPIMKRRE